MAQEWKTCLQASTFSPDLRWMLAQLSAIYGNGKS